MRRILPLLLLFACKSPPPPPAPAPPAVEARAEAADAPFWKWFVAHAAEVATIKRGDEPIANQLADELRKVDSKIVFELGVGKKPLEFIVSADGSRKQFPTVQRLVAAAPAIPGWKVFAFRQRKSMSEIQIDGTRTVKVGDLRFRTLAPPGDTIDVAIYLNGTLDKPAKSAVFILLDSTLGEYDVETRLGEIDILDGKEAPADARPFTELAGLVDAAKKR